MTQEISKILERVQKIEGCFFEKPLDMSVISLDMLPLPSDMTEIYQVANGFHAQYSVFYAFDGVIRTDEGMLQIGESTTGVVYLYDPDTETYQEVDDASGDVFAEYNNLPDFLNYIFEFDTA